MQFSHSAVNTNFSGVLWINIFKYDIQAWMVDFTFHSYRWYCEWLHIANAQENFFVGCVFIENPKNEVCIIIMTGNYQVIIIIKYQLEM